MTDFGRFVADSARASAAVASSSATVRATTATSAPPATLDALHRHFLQILPVIERHGHVYFRYLRCWQLLLFITTWFVREHARKLV